MNRQCHQLLHNNTIHYSACSLVIKQTSVRFIKCEQATSNITYKFTGKKIISLLGIFLFTYLTVLFDTTHQVTLTQLCWNETTVCQYYITHILGFFWYSANTDNLTYLLLCIKFD